MLKLLDVVSFESEIYLYFDILLLQTTIFPSVSPDIIPPSSLYPREVTGLLCYLYTLEHIFPFQYPTTPFPIPVITASFANAIQKLAVRGAFPKIPFLS